MENSKWKQCKLGGSKEEHQLAKKAASVLCMMPDDKPSQNIFER